MPLNVRVDNNLVSLNDIYDAAGRPDYKSPAQFYRLPSCQDLIQSLVNTTNVGKSHIWDGIRGNSGGTWAHKTLAMEYARYLSNDMAVKLDRLIGSGSKSIMSLVGKMNRIKNS